MNSRTSAMRGRRVTISTRPGVYRLAPNLTRTTKIRTLIISREGHPSVTKTTDETRMMNITQKKGTSTTRSSRRHQGGSNPRGDTSLTLCRVARSRITTTRMTVLPFPYTISTRNPRAMLTSRTRSDARAEGAAAKKHPGWRCKIRINGVAMSRRVRCTAGPRRSPR